MLLGTANALPSLPSRLLLLVCRVLRRGVEGGLETGSRREVGRLGSADADLRVPTILAYSPLRCGKGQSDEVASEFDDWKIKSLLGECGSDRCRQKITP
jgi:hypothetical protein